MPYIGTHRIRIKRMIHKRNGQDANYPTEQWVECIDYARCGVWEYIATPTVIFRRIIARYMGFNDGMWEECSFLCVRERGWGSLETFNQVIELLQEERI